MPERSGGDGWRRSDFTRSPFLFLAPRGRLDHYDNAGADRFGQLGPGIHHGGLIGVRYYAIASSIWGSGRGPDWFGTSRFDGSRWVRRTSLSESGFDGLNRSGWEVPGWGLEPQTCGL
jgi:hypothetical protein